MKSQKYCKTVNENQSQPHPLLVLELCFPQATTFISLSSSPEWVSVFQKKKRVAQGHLSVICPRKETVLATQPTTLSILNNIELAATDFWVSNKCSWLLPILFDSRPLQRLTILLYLFVQFYVYYINILQWSH